MYLDMQNLQLSYSINGVLYGKAFDIEDTEYRAAICFDAAYEECIQLLPVKSTIINDAKKTKNN